MRKRERGKIPFEGRKREGSCMRIREWGWEWKCQGNGKGKRREELGNRNEPVAGFLFWVQEYTLRAHAFFNGTFNDFFSHVSSPFFLSFSSSSSLGKKKITRGRREERNKMLMMKIQ